MPEAEGSEGGYSAGAINNLNLKGGKGDGDDPEDGDDDGNAANGLGFERRSNRYDNDSDNEFKLVNSRNVTVSIFTSKNLTTNSYMLLNNQVRRLVVTMGEDGEQLLKILDEVEKFDKNGIYYNAFVQTQKTVPKSLTIR